jgi:tetratricopeptide (TPR) repeat protein
MTSYIGSSRGAWIFVIALGAVLAGFSASALARGETPPAPMPSLDDKPEPLRASYNIFYQQGDQHAVLNAMRVGMDAMQLGFYQEAKEMFDRAIAGIEVIYGNNPQAAKARSLWREEGMKTFKGEPYERAMAYYYRGIIYYMDHDLDNAGACFRAGMLQDTLAEEQSYRCDFAVLDFLNYWASMRRGSKELAEQSRQELLALRPDFIVPPPDSNVIFLVEMGPAPRKLADGVGLYELKFFRGKNRAEVATKISIDEAGPTLSAYPMEDIARQAMTRGGRQIDKILDGKANFASNTSDTGVVLSNAGSNAILASSALSGSAANNVEIVGGAFSVIGAGAQLIAIKVKPEADTRAWDNLPESVHVSGVRLTPGMHQAHVKFYDASGNELAEYIKDVSITVPAKGDILVWVRGRQLLTSGQPNPSTLPPKERYKKSR